MNVIPPDKYLYIPNATPAWMLRVWLDGSSTRLPIVAWRIEPIDRDATEDAELVFPVSSAPEAPRWSMDFVVAHGRYTRAWEPERWWETEEEAVADAMAELQSIANDLKARDSAELGAGG